MKSAEEIMEMLEAFDLTRSYRDAGELAGCSHHTVAHYVQARDAGTLSCVPARRPQLIDEFLPKVEEWVERSQGKVRADVVHDNARIKLFSDGDVAVSIAVARPGSAIDMLVGIGGSPEGIITACAMKAMGGTIQARLTPLDEQQRRRALDAGHDLHRTLTTDDLVAGDNTFFVATGITDGELLAGVHYSPGGARTYSLVMRSRSGTVRAVESDHALDKVRRLEAPQ